MKSYFEWWKNLHNKWWKWRKWIILNNLWNENKQRKLPMKMTNENDNVNYKWKSKMTNEYVKIQNDKWTWRHLKWLGSSYHVTSITMSAVFVYWFGNILLLLLLLLKTKDYQSKNWCINVHIILHPLVFIQI